MAEFCDVCVEVSDGSFFADILHQLGQCLGEGNMPDKDFVSWEETDTEEEALEASKSNSMWNAILGYFRRNWRKFGAGICRHSESQCRKD